MIAFSAREIRTNVIASDVLRQHSGSNSSPSFWAYFGFVPLIRTVLTASTAVSINIDLASICLSVCPVLAD